MAFPRMLLVRQRFPDRRILDLEAALNREFEASALAARLRPGSRVAIGCGSRGIANLAVMVRAAVTYFRSKGMQPFVFPAMGSHGAATAEGQAAVLEHYGVTEAFIGCPVVSSLDVVSLGRTPEGIEVYLDRLAADSDAIFLINRVKWHTSFEGKIESGLFKMMAIGLGKHVGAQAYHTWACQLGLESVILLVGRHLLAGGKILGGLAVVEDANHNTARVRVLPAEEMERGEEELLTLAKSWRGSLPFDLDILILDEIGKDISGTGMDTKVVNRSIEGGYNPWPGLPRVGRIFVRDISELSYGNAVGIGMADIVADRILPRIDWNATQINSLTASTPAGARLPIHFPTDRECLEKIWPTAGRFRREELTIGWIRNTLRLDLLALSENLLAQVRTNPALEVLGEPFELPFDQEGNLVSPLA
mgnify:CR=1 FL=1